MCRLKFDEAGGTQAILAMAYSKDVALQVEAVRCVTNLIQTGISTVTFYS